MKNLLQGDGALALILSGIPKLDEGINEALLDYIARREREIPAVDELNTEH